MNRDDIFLDDNDFVEEEDFESGYGDDETDDDDGYELSPALKRQLEKERESLINQIVSEIAEEKSDGQVYKGLQKVLSKRDLELRELRDTNQQLMNMMNEMGMVVNGVSAGLSWTNKALLENVDEDIQKELANQLKDQEINRLQNRLQYRDAVQQQPQQQPAVDQSAYEEAKRRRDQFIEDQRDLAEAMGLERNDPRLKFGGDDTWNAAEITAAFKQSVKEIMAEEKETKGVIQKKNQPTTRTSGGSGATATAMNARQLLAMGVSQRIKSADSDFRSRRRA